MVELQAVGYAVPTPAQAPASGALPSVNWARSCAGGACAASLSSVYTDQSNNFVYAGAYCVDVSDAV